MAEPAAGGETIGYSYDALGRLVQVQRSGGVNNGKMSCYTLDAAGNRTAATAGTGSCSGGGGGGGGPSFSVNDPSITEGGTLVFTVTKSGTATGTTTVDFATAPGTATAGSDYTAPAPATLSFTSSQTSKTVSVSTIDDTTVESAETVLLNLTNPTGGATVADAQGVGTINDNDSTASCTGVSYSVSSNGPATEGTGSVFTVTKSGSHSGSCTVDYATANGTAVSGSDYTALSGTLSYTSTQTSKLVSVVTIDDSAVEGAETFALNLSNAIGGATIGTAAATATINDNDSAGGACAGVSFSVNDVTVIEGEPINFIVTKTGTTSSSCGLDYATSDGTALAGTHYTARSGTLSFTAAQTTQTVSVTTVDLMRLSGNKIMYLNLTNATLGSVISDSQGKGTIGPSGDPCITCLQSPTPETPPEEVAAPESPPEEVAVPEGEPQ